MDTLSVQLAQLENAQLVRPLVDPSTGSGELAYLFKHALTQETAYASLLLKNRREIHHRVAQAIENMDADQLDENAALLAHHYAEAGDDTKTLEFAIRAGDVAARVYAYPEARAHYAQAMELLARLPLDEENRRTRAATILKQVRVGTLSDAHRRAPRREYHVQARIQFARADRSVGGGERASQRY